MRHFNSFIVLSYEDQYWQTKTKAFYYLPREGRGLQILAFLIFLSHTFWLEMIEVTFDSVLTEVHLVQMI